MREKKKGNRHHTTLGLLNADAKALCFGVALGAGVPVGRWPRRPPRPSIINYHTETRGGVVEIALGEDELPPNQTFLASYNASLAQLHPLLLCRHCCI